jgi:hypothetical protein
MASGVSAGITQGSSGVIAAATSMATNAIFAAKQALGIASPSKVFEGFGSMSALGFAEGFAGGAPTVAATSAGAVTPSLSGGGGNTVNQVNNFDTTVNEAESAAATAKQMKRQQLLQMASSFEQMALELGTT